MPSSRLKSIHVVLEEATGVGVAVAMVLSGGSSTRSTCDRSGAAAHQTQRRIHLNQTGKETLAIDACGSFGRAAENVGGGQPESCRRHGGIACECVRGRYVYTSLLPKLGLC